MNQSELLFEYYLKKQHIDFLRNYPVSSHNVDFCITREHRRVLCDVKEVRNSEKKLQEQIDGVIDAQDHIRGDLKKLRQKFVKQPDAPLVLISMNFSSNFFTALTISRALLGEIGVIYDRNPLSVVSDIHHLHGGNATLRHNINTSISGLFVFDVRNNNHCLFRSPYANIEIPEDFFSNIRVVNLYKNETSEEIMTLGKIMFWPMNKK